MHAASAQAVGAHVQRPLRGEIGETRRREGAGGRRGSRGHRQAGDSRARIEGGEGARGGSVRQLEGAQTDRRVSSIGGQSVDWAPIGDGDGDAVGHREVGVVDVQIGRRRGSVEARPDHERDEYVFGGDDVHAKVGRGGGCVDEQKLNSRAFGINHASFARLERRRERSRRIRAVFAVVSARSPPLSILPRDGRIGLRIPSLRPPHGRSPRG